MTCPPCLRQIRTFPQSAAMHKTQLDSGSTGWNGDCQPGDDAESS
jgi:hypothetical protein